MRYFPNQDAFDEEMEKVKDILERKGFVLESDHPYAYAMQYDAAFEDVKEWLINHGYEGELNYMGAFEGVAVYGLYDSSQITYEEMRRRLLMEARAQNQLQ